VWARPRMSQEPADSLIELRADDVLKLAGTRIRFLIGDQERVRKKPFRQTTAADNISGAIPALWREGDLAVVRFEQPQILEARDHEGGI